MKVAPGPKGHILLGNLRERRDHPLEFHLDAARRFGPVARYRIGPIVLHLLDDASFIKHVLVDHHRNYVKGFGYDKLVPILGHGLLTTEGETWRRQRRLAQPAFHRQRLEILTQVMSDCIARRLESWEKPFKQGSPLDLSKEMMRLTLAIVGSTLLSRDVTEEADEVGRSVTFLLSEANRRILTLLPFWDRIPTPSSLRFKRHLGVLDRVVFQMIRERRQSSVDHGDLMSMLMLAKDEETGESMSDRQVRDEVMTIFLAGHETTANALSWIWVLLAKHPEVERKVVEELKKVLGGRTPRFEDLTSLLYLTQVIEEAMRLYPPAWAISRRALSDDEIGGFHIPARSMLILSPYVTQRNPLYWDHPAAFDPGRFSSENASVRPKFSYFPFGGGPRICIGNGFAMMEIQLILATVIQKYRMELLPGHPIEPEAHITLRPRFGVRMVLGTQS